MPQITLPDNSQKQFDAPVSPYQVAESISKSLAKNTLFAIVDGVEWDAGREIANDATIELVTKDDERSLELIRHDAAHVMAQAVKELYPDVQVTIGPAIKDGFYYDFYREQPFTPEDLPKIEKRMREIVKRNETITRHVWNRDEAIQFFRGQGEEFKAELIEDLPADETITVYKQGVFQDLCRGPHLPSTGKLGTAFKLTKIAGSYWRGDSDKAQLQRIYGTAWASQEQLDAYLHRLEEAEKRDHRKLGREMDLYHFQPEAAGSIFWHEKGYIIYRALENYIRQQLEQQDYKEVKTPQLIDNRLWEQSGHWGKFRENMFVVPDEVPSTEDDKPIFSGNFSRLMAIKPMNCPAHVQIFKQGTKSYRDLPLRMAEFGCCHRNEPQGALHGLMRVRQMTQDDAHIFCTEDQIITESTKFCELLLKVYKDLGFEQVDVKLALRPQQRAGSDETWDKAENGLRQALIAANLEFTEEPEEGAFYGPKLEFHLTDAIGRTWQCGTLQLDFVLPERLDANYIDENGERQRPVMLHRAILGSMERFIGILIENYAGNLPLWLAPVQAVVATITNSVDDHATKVYNQLKDAGLRVELDLRSEKIGYKVREHSTKKVPYILAIGAQEAENNTVAVRRLGTQGQQVEDFGILLNNLKTAAKIDKE